MKRREYPIEDLDMNSIVYEVDKHKDILDILDEKIENSVEFGWDAIFENDFFYIEYKDGLIYEAGADIQEGKYRKKNIKRMYYVNENDTLVYGAYLVNKYGYVY